MIMSGNEAWNRNVFKRWRKVDRDGADITLSGRLFQTVGPATGKARPPTVDSFTDGTSGRRMPSPKHVGDRRMHTRSTYTQTDRHNASGGPGGGRTKFKRHAAIQRPEKRHVKALTVKLPRTGAELTTNRTTRTHSLYSNITQSPIFRAPAQCRTIVRRSSNG